MAHHANDGSASRTLRGLLREHGCTSREQFGAAIALRMAQDQRCARGEHDPAQAQKGYVTYIGFGQRVEPGTWYCRGCKKILPDQEDSDVV